MAGQRRSTTIDVDDRAFLVGLRRAFDQLQLRTDAAVLRLAIDTQNRARELCPVDTGRLRASIVHVPGRDARGYFVDVGSNVEYAGFVEFGTSKQPASPFLRPALAEAVQARLNVRGVA